MKIHLVFPNTPDHLDAFSMENFYTSLVRKIFRMGCTNLIPPLGLLLLAAVTPRDIDVQLIDERLDCIDYDESVDLVGISIVTKSAKSAYQIADNYRQRGVAVVLGGIHPTILPEEAQSHADSIVIGEGERVWPILLDDFKQGKLRARYYGGHNANIKNLPWARRNIIREPEKYLTTKIIMATRGCENNCTFCSNGVALGKKYRMREVDDVIAEIESIQGKFVNFLDDNLGWNIEYAKKLFTVLIPSKVKWSGSTTLPAIEDDELVELISKSGCIALDLGFESISHEVIQAIHKQKTNNVDYYRKLINKLHKHNIPIYGNFILGFDQDDTGIFNKVVEFIEEVNIDSPMVNVLIPYPGSMIYRQFEHEGRLFHKNWEYYDDAPGCIVYRPMHMSPQELLEGFIYVISKVNSPLAYLRRMIRLAKNNLFGFGLGLIFNLQKYSNVLKGREKARNAFENESKFKYLRK